MKSEPATSLLLPTVLRYIALLSKCGYCGVLALVELDGSRQRLPQSQRLTGDDATFHLVGQMLSVDYDVPREVVKFFASAIAGEDLEYVDLVLV